MLLVLESSPGAGQRCPNSSGQGQCWKWRCLPHSELHSLFPSSRLCPGQCCSSRAVLCAEAGAAAPVHPQGLMELPMGWSHSSAREQRRGGETGSDQECELGSEERNLGISELCQRPPSFVLFVSKCSKAALWSPSHRELSSKSSSSWREFVLWMKDLLFPLRALEPRGDATVSSCLGLGLSAGESQEHFTRACQD